jgi:hypothetical protein
LTPEFIRENWANLVMYVIVSWCELEFIERYINESSDKHNLHWYEINLNPHLNMEFINKYFDYLSVHVNLYHHAIITIDFLDSHNCKGELYK